jgi:hypothetical protein
LVSSAQKHFIIGEKKEKKSILQHKAALYKHTVVYSEYYIIRIFNLKKLNIKT